MEKQSYNPKFRALVERVQPQLDAFEHENRFLGGFIKEVFNNRRQSYRMGYAGAEALVKLLKATGVDAIIRRAEDVDLRPDAFWILMEAAAKATGGKEAITGILCLYHHFYRKKLLKETFKNAEKSPMPFIHTRSFVTLMLKEYTCLDDLFYIGYSKNRNKAPIVLPWANKDLRGMVVEAFLRWPNMYDRSSATLRLLYESEEWFEDKGKDIHSYKDLTAEVLSTAIGHIMSLPKGKWRTVSMQFLFWVFSVQITKHPEHRFFEGSHLWTPGLVINRFIPKHLADGYRFALFGQTDEVKQDKGVLMIVKNGDLFSANGMKNEVYRIDFSDVTVPLYWKALANYAVRLSVFRAHGAKRFVKWLIQYKKRRGLPYERVTADEMNAYRAHISRLSIQGTARNHQIQEARQFLTWASDAGHIAVDEFAMNDFLYFDYHYVPQPEPLNKKTIRKLIEACDQMAQEFDVRFALVLRIIRILLSCEIRVGALVRMTMDDLRFNEDGTVDYLNRIKSKGVNKFPLHLTKVTANLIRECIQLTESVRDACPAGLHDGCVFIYKNGPSSSLPFGVFNRTRINQDFKRASQKAGLKRTVTSGQLRDTYMTAAERFARKHGYNALQQSVLTKHANKLSTRSYVKIPVSDLLIAAKDVKLGNL